MQGMTGVVDPIEDQGVCVQYDGDIDLEWINLRLKWRRQYKLALLQGGAL